VSSCLVFRRRSLLRPRKPWLPDRPSPFQAGNPPVWGEGEGPVGLKAGGSPGLTCCSLRMQLQGASLGDRGPGRPVPFSTKHPSNWPPTGPPALDPPLVRGQGGATSQPDCRGGAVGDSSPKLRGETMKPKLEGLRIGQGRASDPVFIAQNLGNFGQND
jgi:hypothetical protein